MIMQLDLFAKRSQIQTAEDPILAAHRFSKVYHNTTGKKGEDLNLAQVKASKQTEIILRIFRQHPHTSFTPWDVYNHLGQQMMITSVRRAITTLTDAGHLQRTEERRRSGPAGETNHTWRLTEKP